MSVNDENYTVQILETILVILKDILFDRANTGLSKNLKKKSNI